MLQGSQTDPALSQSFMLQGSQMGLAPVMLCGGSLTVGQPST
jgi:hypothetical protein